MLISTAKSVPVRRRKGLRGLGVSASYIDASGARIVYDTTNPPPGVAAAAGTSFTPIAPPARQASNLPDGTFIKTSAGEVSVMQGGQRWHIYGWDTVDALGGTGHVVTIPDSQYYDIPNAGMYRLVNGVIAIFDAAGNLLTTEPATANTVATTAAASPAAVTSLVPNTTAAGRVVYASAPSSSSMLGSLTSVLPSWWPYAAIAGVGWLLLGNKKGRR